MRLELAYVVGLATTRKSGRPNLPCQPQQEVLTLAVTRQPISDLGPVAQGHFVPLLHPVLDDQCAATVGAGHKGFPWLQPPLSPSPSNGWKCHFVPCNLKRSHPVSDVVYPLCAIVHIIASAPSAAPLLSFGRYGQ